MCQGWTVTARVWRVIGPTFLPLSGSAHSRGLRSSRRGRGPGCRSPGGGRCRGCLGGRGSTGRCRSRRRSSRSRFFSLLLESLVAAEERAAEGGDVPGGAAVAEDAGAFLLGGTDELFRVGGEGERAVASGTDDGEGVAGAPADGAEDLGGVEDPADGDEVEVRVGFDDVFDGDRWGAAGFREEILGGLEGFDDGGDVGVEAAAAEDEERLDVRVWPVHDDDSGGLAAGVDADDAAHSAASSRWLR